MSRVPVFPRSPRLHDKVKSGLTLSAACVAYRILAHRTTATDTQIKVATNVVTPYFRPEKWVRSLQKAVDEAHPLAKRTLQLNPSTIHRSIKLKFQMRQEGFRTQLRCSDQLLPRSTRPLLLPCRYDEHAAALQTASKDDSARLPGIAPVYATWDAHCLLRRISIDREGR